jgi:dTDP-4-amino-4,6-dideoxygalactose transaminase
MFPHTEAAGASLLALPFHARLSMDDVERVCAAVAEELAHAEVA